MEFYQVSGKTWVFEALEMLPIYRIDEKRCIMFDTGFPQEQKKLEEGLEEHNLEPVAIVCSHAHIDHVGAGAYFHEKYQIPLYISQEEAGILCSYLNLKAYRPHMTPNELRLGIGMLCTTATEIPVGAEHLEVCGMDLRLHVSRGHSSGHLAFGLPDGVCYLADSVLCGVDLGAKLPFAVDIASMIAHYEEIRHWDYDKYIIAHKGIVEKSEMSALLDQNRDMFLERAEEIKLLLEQGKTVDQLCLDFCQKHQLNTRKPKRVQMYQRTLRFFLEYLEDEGLVVLDLNEQGLIYRPRQR